MSGTFSAPSSLVRPGLQSAQLPVNDLQLSILATTTSARRVVHELHEVVKVKTLVADSVLLAKQGVLLLRGGGGDVSSIRAWRTAVYYIVALQTSTQRTGGLPTLLGESGEEVQMTAWITCPRRTSNKRDGSSSPTGSARQSFHTMMNDVACTRSQKKKVHQKRP